VLWKDAATFHQSTDGDLFIERPREKSSYFDKMVVVLRKWFPVKLSSNIKGVMYGKLLVNLINSVNALSGRYQYMPFSSLKVSQQERCWEITTFALFGGPLLRRAWKCSIKLA
jgi:hypothetical protein